MTALCVGCGCDEQHACEIPADLPAGDPDRIGCWWLRFDADAGVGVCSACADLLGVWDQARAHPPLWPLIAERFYRQVMFLYEDRAAALKWLVTPQPLLGDRSPRELILAGRIEEVQTVLNLLRDGAFV